MVAKQDLLRGMDPIGQGTHASFTYWSVCAASVQITCRFFTSAPPICSRCNLLYTSGLTVKGINNLLFIGLAMTEDMKIPTLDPKELLQASWLLLVVTKDVGPCSCPSAMFIA